MIEKLFDMTNFEQSLKEYADDFTIVPTRKVWQGIYNNMHPGRRWPSLPMAFMLLLSLLGIGYLNNSTINTAQRNFDLKEKNVTSGSDLLQKNSPGNKLSIASINKDYKPDQNNSLESVVLQKVEQSDERLDKSNELVNGTKTKENRQETSSQLEIQPKNINTIVPQSSNLQLESELMENKQIASEEIISGSGQKISPENKDVNKLPVNQEMANVDVAKIIAKKLPRITFSYFLMPTVTNAYFASNGEKDLKTENSLVIINPNNPSSNRILNAQLGLRVGGQVEYHINPKLQVLLMGQLAYSGYTVISNNETLSTGKLSLKDKAGPVYSKAYFTSYGNGKSEKQVPLKNYSIQVSIPLGVQYEVWHNNDAGIFISTAAGPSFILKSNAHLLSSDGRNYVDDESLMRPINYTGYLGTHIEFKAKSMKWRIGPTVSYQLLSTYQDKYPGKEHLIDYGIKIGISK